VIEVVMVGDDGQWMMIEGSVVFVFIFIFIFI
jgi:hypothetical protein